MSQIIPYADKYPEFYSELQKIQDEIAVFEIHSEQRQLFVSGAGGIEALEKSRLAYSVFEQMNAEFNNQVIETIKKEKQAAAFLSSKSPIYYIIAYLDNAIQKAMKGEITEEDKIIFTQILKNKAQELEETEWNSAPKRKAGRPSVYSSL